MFVNNVHFEGGLVVFGQGFGAEHEEGGGDGLVGFLLVAFVGQEVSGNLFVDEVMEGFVVVECLDDVVPISPCGIEGHVDAAAIGVGVAGKVEPVAAPAFAEGFRGQEFVSNRGDGGVGILFVLFQEVLDLCRCWRESGQVKMDSAK